MRILPTQTGRSAFLLAILYSMALFVPCAWIAMYHRGGNIMESQTYLALFQWLVVLVAAIAGTRRRVFLGIAACSSFAVVYVLSLSYDFEGLAERTIYHRNGQPALPFKGEFVTGILGMLTPAVAMFAATFALSFLFDWFLQPVDPAVESDSDQPNESKGKANRFKMLALLAVPLFIAQTSSNMGRGSGVIAIAAFLLVGFAVACRLSLWKGLLTLVAIAVAILFTAIGLLSINMGGDMRFNNSAMLLVGILATLIPVWLLVGKYKTAAERKPGWLSAVACLLLGGVAWIYVQYDPGTLLFGSTPFDFEVAKSVRKINSHPSVRVKLSTWYGETQCEIEFKDDKSVDDFFVNHPLPDLPLNVTISSMPETVDLTPLEKLTVRNLRVSDSAVSSSQLVSLAKSQQTNGFYLVNFNGCRFVPEEVQWPAKFKPNFGLGMGYGHLGDANLKSFLEAVKDLDALKLHAHGLNEEDYSAVAEALKKKGSGLELNCDACSPEFAAALAGIEGLSNVSLSQVALEDHDQNPVRSGIELVLNSEATIRASNVQNDQLVWDLMFAAGGRLTIDSYRNVEPNQVRDPDVPWNLDAKKIRDFHWVYDESQAAEDVTKLFVPFRRSQTTSQLVNFPKLKSLSFDRAWARASIHLAVDDREVNLKPIKGIIELKELYMPSYGARHQLNLLEGQEKLETFQFNASSEGFRESRFPNLKHIILVVDVGTPGEDLLRELALLQRLEKLTLAVNRQYMSQSFVADPKQLVKLFEGVLPGVNVETLRPYETYLPDDFTAHCERVREGMRKKYLK